MSFLVPFTYLLLSQLLCRLLGRWILFILINAWNATAVRVHAMPYEIGTLLLSFSVCTHDNEGNVICHEISGAYNDDFVATLVKRVTCLLKCFDQCFGVCDKPLLNAWTLIIMLENGVPPSKHVCLKLRDDPGQKYFAKIIVSTFVKTYNTKHDFVT